MENYLKKRSEEFLESMSNKSYLYKKYGEDYLDRCPVNEVQSFHTQSITGLLEMIEKWAEKRKINWKYKKNTECNVCWFVENSGEAHQCEAYNSALSDLLNFIRTNKSNNLLT